MKKLFFVSSLLVSAFANAQNVPSHSMGKDLLENKYKNSECVNFLSFSKEDGQYYEYGGAQSYRMAYAAKVSLKPGCFGFYSNESKKFWGAPNKKYSKQGEENMKTINYRLIKEGEEVSIAGRIDFYKSEKGWQGNVSYAW